MTSEEIDELGRAWLRSKAWEAGDPIDGGGEAYLALLGKELAYRKDFQNVEVRHVGPTVGGDMSIRGRCHSNAKSWLAIHGGTRIFGWLVDTSDIAVSGRIKFYAHSFVGAENGEYLDLTLPPDQAPLPFLQADMPEEQFDWVAQRRPILDFVIDANLDQEFRQAVNDLMGIPRDDMD